MIKKAILLLVLIVSSIFAKAQVTSLEYPSGFLSEEKITTILEVSRKKGVKEWEVQKQNEFLHREMKKQALAMANGTYYNQKNVTPLPRQVASAGCNNAGFEDGTSGGWSFMQGSNSSQQNLPCPTCFTAAGGVYEVTSYSGNSQANNSAGNTAGGNQSNQNIGSGPTEPYANGVDYYGGFSVVAP